MPIYEYQCRRCGHTFEKLVRSTAGSTAVPCDACGAAEVEKLVSSFAFRGGGESGTTTAASGSSCGGCSHTHCSTCGK